MPCRSSGSRTCLFFFSRMSLYVSLGSLPVRLVVYTINKPYTIGPFSSDKSFTLGAFIFPPCIVPVHSLSEISIYKFSKVLVASFVKVLVLEAPISKNLKNYAKVKQMILLKAVISLKTDRERLLGYLARMAQS